MNGLFLQGGGAKGAFQAGAICAFHERGVEFSVISATSIGAINSYYVYAGEHEKLMEFWNDVDEDMLRSSMHRGIIIDNSYLIEPLNRLRGRNKKVKSLKVNYVNVTGSRLRECFSDIAELSSEEAIEKISYSSSIPLKTDEEKSIGEILGEFDSSIVFEKFRKDIEKGTYNGYNLDGGILNNNFVQPFEKTRVDRLFMISLKNEYEIPQEIKCRYKEEQLVLLKPTRKIQPMDTLKFERDFCRGMFEEGYNAARNVNVCKSV